MKKLAILYYGIPQHYCFKQCFENIKQYIIDSNPNYEVDIFIHNWIEDKHTKDWLPWYNHDKLNPSCLQQNDEFIKTVVKPKIYKKEIFKNFTKSQYEKELGSGWEIKYKMLYNNLLNKYGLFDDVSRSYSMKQANNYRLQYEKEFNCKYDKILILESYTYLFEPFYIDNITDDKIYIWGSWPWSKKIPNYFKHSSSGHYIHPSFYDILVIGNNKNINKWCKYYNNYKQIIKYPYPKVTYRQINYIQAEYGRYLNCIIEKIPYQTIELLGGVYRQDGVKISLHTCPISKIHLINQIQRKDGKILPKDAREYITKI